jgi:GNAT superfamily N-acetyltransferase
MPDNMIQILSLSDVEIRSYFTQMADIYATAFAGSPYNETLGDVLTFSGLLPFHARRQGFKCVLAVDGIKDKGVVGFAYGYDSQPDNWWRMQVSARIKPDLAAEWLSSCFELVELAVIPAFWGQGIGGKLHDALLSGLPHRTAILSTAQSETNALHLYRRRGWVTLMDNFIFPGASLTFLIMGLRLDPK